MFWLSRQITITVTGLLLAVSVLLARPAQALPGGFKSLPAFRPATRFTRAPIGDLPVTNRLTLALGLPLHHRDQLQTLIAQLYDPRSTNFHRFLAPADFAARFGPTPAEYQEVAQFAASHGLLVTRQHRNRLVLDVAGSVSDVGRAFQVHFRTYRHPFESRNFFAPDGDPLVPTNLPVADVWGLTDYRRPHPQVTPDITVANHPFAAGGSAPNGLYQGRDFRNAYVPGSPLNGAGQTVALVEFDGYYPADIAAYESQCGYAPVPLQNVYLDSADGTPDYEQGQIPNAVLEVSLDIEMTIAMAPGLSQVLIYEGDSPYDVYNAIAADNQARQISSSWIFEVDPSDPMPEFRGTIDSILSEMTAQGQAFFQASGDQDAYTGGEVLNAGVSPIPVDSIYVTCVGGTSLNMQGQGAQYASENAWNWGNNTGSGGGVSTNYSIPSWQSAVDMTANLGSSVYRNLPDVALTADNVEAVHDNGNSSFVGGTSCAAPLWAGFCALINQQSVGTTPGGAGAGFLNPALYLIGAGSNYTACFNDITNGNNVGANTPGLYPAVSGYDLCTGWGTPNGTNLINALAPLALPFFVTPPVNSAVVFGSNVSFAATISGAAPIGLQWQFDGVNLVDSASVSGSTSNILTLTAAAMSDMGGYTLVLTNVYGAVTSSIAALAVGFAPAITDQPANLVIPAGSIAQLSVAATGSDPLCYRWQINGQDLTPDHASFLGTTSNLLTISAASTTNSGDYEVIITNLFGAVTSSVASLLVYAPPSLTASSLTNQIVQCGSNQLTFSVTVAGTPPVALQWLLDGVVVDFATNNTFALTNLEFPDHVLSVSASNAYGAFTNSALLTLQDSLPPVITLKGLNPLYVELGTAFADPGAIANDACAGPVPVSVSGSVNSQVVGTYSLIYAASDPSGNTAGANRTVIVQDTTPPTILGSFTNLILSADPACSAPMPDVTGTNDIIATDLSPPLVITQSPPKQSNLPVGTNLVVIAVADAYGNTAYSTNTIVVQDDTPPVIVMPPVSQTNLIGDTVSFSAAATACTPESWQWLFNTAALPGATNDTLVLSNLTLASTGNYSVLVTSAGGAVTSTVASLTVNLLPANGTLVSSENPSGFNDPVSFTVGVVPVGATGTVDFYTNGVAFDQEVLAAGQVASAVVSTLPRGTNLITAVYSGDAGDLPFTNTLSQVVTNHPPSALPATFSRAAGASLSIPISQLATGWSDLDGDPVSLADITPSTNGVTVMDDGFGTLTYINSNNVPDQFDCVLTDGFGGTNDQTVNISVVFPGIVAELAQDSSAIILDLTGVAGQTYVLETTTNLTGPVLWLPLATNTLDPGADWQFSDTDYTNYPQRFYRLITGN